MTLAILLSPWVVSTFAQLVWKGLIRLASELTYRTDGETSGRDILVQTTVEVGCVVKLY